MGVVTIKSADWDRVREQFSEEEKQQPRAATVGVSICPAAFMLENHKVLLNRRSIKKGNYILYSLDKESQKDSSQRCGENSRRRSSSSMFTVKLKRGSFTKIVGADRVHIRPCGKDPKIIAPKDGPDTSIQAIDCISGLHGIETYYVSHQPLTEANSFEKGEEFDAAYIENANGQTTEKVHANN